ncbi:hypothetical protein [Nonomuraea sp. NPDC048826]|uniref:hypothetical protein n=1 Tax=Nonomuraea sp. NPDC048826 TaxID=3364347 RepID=UPI0037158A78
MTTFDAILCDLDGVLRQFDHAVQADIEARYGLPLRATAFDPAIITPATLGHITTAQRGDSIITALGGSEAARKAVAEFKAVPFRVDEEVRALPAATRGRMPPVLVTNAMDDPRRRAAGAVTPGSRHGSRPPCRKGCRARQ